MSPSSTAGFLFGEVRGVALACQNHVAGVVGDDGIIVSGCVIDKLFHLLNSVCSVGLYCWVEMVPSAMRIVGSTDRA